MKGMLIDTTFLTNDLLVSLHSQNYILLLLDVSAAYLCHLVFMHICIEDRVMRWFAPLPQRHISLI